MKLKSILVILLSALSLTVFAQQKPTLLIQEPQGGNQMLNSMLIGALTDAAVQSNEYQPISEQNRLAALANGDTQQPAAQYMLFTQIQNLGEETMVSIKIVEVETLATVKALTEWLGAAQNPDTLREQCTEISKKIFASQKQ